MATPARPQNDSGLVRVLVIGDEAGPAALAWRMLDERKQRSRVGCSWVPRLRNAITFVRSAPVELIFVAAPVDTEFAADFRLLRRLAGDTAIVGLTVDDYPETVHTLNGYGFDEHLSEHNVGPTAIGRILGRAIERRQLKAQIEASMRREQLRDAILARIAENAPLQDVLDELGRALRQELSCDDCGFAIKLPDDSGRTLLWPDGSSSALLASQALANACDEPTTNRGANCQACLESIRSGGRLLGELAMIPGASAAAQDTIQAYAALGAELAALAVDRLRTADSLRRSHEELRQLSARLLMVQETERQRIAGDLHDVIGQSLSVVKVSIEEAEREFRQNGAPEVAAALGRLVPWVKTALGEVHRISMDLRPATIDDLGIIPTLSWFFREFGSSCRGIAVEPTIAVTEQEIPDTLKIAIFRIIQEAFSNIVKHAQAQRIQVTLARLDARIHLTVADDGQGFDPNDRAHTDDRRLGIGLSTMRERARVSSGSYTLQSTRGSGTRITVSWPLPD